MLKKGSILLTLALVISLFSGCGQEADTATDNHLQVTVSYNAMAEFAKAVGGDLVTINTIVPSGSEPHDFEPKAQDLAGMNKADIFIYNGLGMESWAEDAIDAAQNDALIVVEAADAANLIKNPNYDGDEHHDEDEDEHHDDAEDEHHDEDEHHHDHGEYDPHVWLSLKNAQLEAEAIKNAFVSADPENTDAYEANFTRFYDELDRLYNEYNEKFATISQTTFVTGHAAFGYLCNEFGLKQNSVEDMFAEGEPSAQQLGELVDFCKEHNIGTIFAEELASPAVSQTLADEVGAEVKTIYTIESDEDGKTYLERMQDNLATIYDSLQ